MFKKSKFILIFFAAQMLWAGLVTAENQEDKVLAHGDGFQVTQSFVQGLEDYYSRGGFRTTREEMVKAAARVKAFTRHARETGLVETLPEEQSSREGITRLMRIYEYYIYKMAVDYPLAENVVESYYHSNPQKFIKDSDKKMDSETQHKSGGYIRSEDLMPLDPELNAQIRMQVLASKRSAIIKERFEMLKQEYNIEFTKTNKKG